MPNPLIDDLVLSGKIAPRQVQGFKSFDIIAAAAQYNASLADGRVPNMPTVAPPFELMAMEFPTPLSLGGLIRDVNCVVLLRAFDVLEGPREGWVVAATACFEVGTREYASLGASVVRFIDRDGDLSKDGDSEQCEQIVRMDPRYREFARITHKLPPVIVTQADAEQAAAQIQIYLFGPCLFAMSLMQCTGVTLRHSKSVNSKLLKRQLRGYRLPEHHTIEIRDRGGELVDTTALESAMRESSEGVRLHIRRGHFMTFTPERPGGRGRNVVGTFWVPACVVGDEGAGLITSEYRVG